MIYAKGNAQQYSRTAIKAKSFTSTCVDYTVADSKVADAVRCCCLCLGTNGNTQLSCIVCVTHQLTFESLVVYDQLVALNALVSGASAASS